MTDLKSDPNAGNLTLDSLGILKWFMHTINCKELKLKREPVPALVLNKWTDTFQVKSKNSIKFYE